MTPTVSFIVIGKNEGFKLEMCLIGIKNFIRQQKITAYEIIYVDSRSRDHSLEMVRAKFPDVKTLILTGDCSAGIARNAGASVAVNSLLIFLDGDMVLNSHFSLNDRIQEGNWTLFSGQLKNHFYDETFSKIIGTNLYYPGLDFDRKERFFGGLLVIDSLLWNKYNGMRSEFLLGEDLDLSLRLSSDGYFLTRYMEIMADHHTLIKTLKINDLWRNASYTRGLLYRKNLFRRSTPYRILRSDPTVPLLILTLLFCIVSGRWIFFSTYIVLVLIATIWTERKSKKQIANRFFLQLIRDIFVVIHFFTFFPAKKDESYKLIS